MRRVLPHRQLDQLPEPEIITELVSRTSELPFVRTRQSAFASPGTHALCLSDQIATGPRAAFIDSDEFCHIHPLPESGIHLMLPHPLREQVIRLGWGEAHPITSSGILESLVTLYVPRDGHEMATALYLISQSCLFAQGKFDGENSAIR
jgi:phospholipase/carboxylesterase